MASLLSQYKSAITLSFVFFCVSTPPSQTLEAFDIEFSHFNLVNFNLTLDPSSMFNPNISIVQFEGVGKFGYDSSLKSVSEGLCMPPDNSGKWSRYVYECYCFFMKCTNYMHSFIMHVHALFSCCELILVKESGVSF